MTVSTSEAWQRLQAQGARLAASHLRDLFAADPQRVERLSADFDGLHLDYSKQRVNAEAMDGLVALAEAAALPAKIERGACGPARCPAAFVRPVPGRC